MLWNMIVEAQGEGELTASITIEATNWYSALRAGLEKHHIDGSVLSSLSCRVQSDNSVIASDMVSKRVFVLRQTPDGGAAEERESIEGHAGLVSHDVFFARDDYQGDESDIYYRERLIAVDSDVSRSAAAYLAQHYFEMLKAEEIENGCKKFISVHVYDHSFDARSERPAIVALTWREWMPSKPKILYPLSGDEGVTFSMLPPPSEPILLVPKMYAQSDAPARSSHVDGWVSESRFGIGERMIAAFEGMQDIYGIHDHDEAAAFVLSLARDLICCEAGSCMLVSPKQYELYVSAVEGQSVEAYLGNTVSSMQGILGFALKNSAVITVSDPSGDARFEDTFDGREGFAPRNVLCAPMQFEGQVIGVLELINSERAGGFIEEESNVLSYISTSFAEYAAMSLPSRHADFSDRDFTSRQKKQVMLNTVAQAPKKEVSSDAFKKAAAPVDNADEDTALKPVAKTAPKPGKGKRSSSKKKKKR